MPIKTHAAAPQHQYNKPSLSMIATNILTFSCMNSSSADPQQTTLKDNQREANPIRMQNTGFAQPK